LAFIFIYGAALTGGERIPEDPNYLTVNLPYEIAPENPNGQGVLLDNVMQQGVLQSQVILAEQFVKPLTLRM
jgi:hypothetical protein